MPSSTDRVFLFETSAVRARLAEPLAALLPGVRLVALDEMPPLTHRELSQLGRGEGLLVVVRSGGVPEAQELAAFARAAEQCLVGHEKRAFALPMFSTRGAAAGEALAAAFPGSTGFAARFGGEAVFAVKRSVLGLLAPPSAEVRGFDWAEFSRAINAHGFSVERVPAGIRSGAAVPLRPGALPDLASFFASSMEPRERKWALDLSNLRVARNGTNEYALNVGRALIELDRGRRRWVVLATAPVREAFGLEEWGVEVVAPDAVDGVFDLVFVPHQIYNPAQLKFVGSIALRYALCMLDAITLRCGYITEARPLARPVSSLAVQHATALLSLSRAGADDVRSYYESEGLTLAVEPVLITKTVEPALVESGPPYALVIGNEYRHKAIEPFLSSYFENPASIALVIIADEATRARCAGRKDVEVLVSGDIPEDRMATLYASAAVVVFPSLYEGFGLPVAEGLLRGKRVLAVDTEVNREVKQAFDRQNALELFPSHAALVAFLRELASRPGGASVEGTVDHEPVRSWRDVAEETARVLERASEEPVHWPGIAARHRDIRNLADLSSKEAALRATSFRRLSEMLVDRIGQRARTVARKISARIDPRGRGRG